MIRRPARIISGGQTGVDRGALDAAIQLGIPQGGACPRGRRAEDGVIPARYSLVECGSAHYAERTRRNVADSCGTLILCAGALSSGTALTRDVCHKLGKPLLVLDLDARPDGAALRAFLAEHRVEVLNVAGPRESGCPGIAGRAFSFLCAALSGEP